MAIPYAPLIQVTVTDATEGGVPVLTMQTKLTRSQVLELDTINQIVALMQEAMEEILNGGS